MRLQLKRTVQASIEEAWSEYTAPGNRACWDATLESFETIQGKPGYPGSLAHVTYRENGVAIETTEWVVERTAPIVYRTVHDAPGGVLRLDNCFDRTGEGTYWQQNVDLRLKMLGLKLLAPILRIKLRKRLERDMDAFIAYVAGPDAVRTRVTSDERIESGRAL